MSSESFFKLSDAIAYIEEYETEDCNEIILLPPEDVCDDTDLEDNVINIKEGHIDDISSLECAGHIEVFRPETLVTNHKNKYQNLK